MKRRDLFKAFAVIVTAPACRKAQAAFTCTDTSGLSFDDTNARTTLAYTDRTADPLRACLACQQYVQAPSDSCGTCKVLKGPIHPNGTCKSFAAKG